MQRFLWACLFACLSITSSLRINKYDPWDPDVEDENDERMKTFLYDDEVDEDEDVDLELELLEVQGCKDDNKGNDAAIKACKDEKKLNKKKWMKFNYFSKDKSCNKEKSNRKSFGKYYEFESGKRLKMKDAAELNTCYLRKNMMWDATTGKKYKAWNMYVHLCDPKVGSTMLKTGWFQWVNNKEGDALYKTKKEIKEYLKKESCTALKAQFATACENNPLAGGSNNCYDGVNAKRTNTCENPNLNTAKDQRAYHPGTAALQATCDR